MADNYLFDSLLAAKLASAEGRNALFATLPEDGRRYSYGDVEEVSGRFANVLVGLGVNPGDRVAVQVPKSIESIMLYLAVVRAGAVFLPLNTGYTPVEIEYFLGNATPRIFVCDPKKRADYEALTSSLGIGLETMGVWQNHETSAGSLPDAGLAAPTVFDTVSRSADDLAAILYTSGTTGRSKGAMLSHANLVSNAETLADVWHFTKDDVLLHALPIFHTHGLFVATNVTLSAGASLIFLSGFSAETIITNIPGATSLMGVPTFYTRLLDEPGFTADLVKHMRLFVSGSAPLLAETHVQFEQCTGHRILERYGMTETNMNTSNPYDGERRAGTVGFPLPGVDLRIVDAETGKALPQGEIGIIEVKGPNVFSGYWQMPEKTREEFREDGFFITGDVGVIDVDGYVQIVGRSKDLIISGGYNIYPKELELLLDEDEGVLESAVIGVPHPDFGEAVVAVLVPKPAAKLDEAGIMESIQSKIARFKQPKRIVVLDELPRNTMGKVQKNVLRDTYKALFSA
ncbi:Acyl-CoA synthetase (AMP-forming)/AMP-acid ligase II [Hoeflea phototrophica DFL-43]|uniref:Acyl-CoA synthetase (AMP-forming)/AMP-acid ligase II n=2 Tax=Hoeflea TaxID=274591 RepID=A9CXI4_HOEPD|nr:malonyl-CoA synthase [Hoeflea phototrophica]EDQ35664.2 Acyl-CoA synthetase (AMP-forming)/AMP-acid ligase II [Hoeflea phototrophica DFL-43]